VDSARVLYDRRGGKNPTYAFLSFSSAAERDAALSMNGTVKAH
jgi:polyadenylate-binding protein